MVHKTDGLYIMVYDIRYGKIGIMVVYEGTYHLVTCYIAMEYSTFTDDLPIKTGDSL